jgi:hypothetical protein
VEKMSDEWKRIGTANNKNAPSRRLSFVEERERKGLRDKVSDGVLVKEDSYMYHEDAVTTT